MKSQGISNRIITKADSIPFSAKGRTECKPKNGEIILWWVLPFHPVIFSSRLARRLKATMVKWKRHIDAMDNISISWKNERQAQMFTLRW